MRFFKLFSICSLLLLMVWQPLLADDDDDDFEVSYESVMDVIEERKPSLASLIESLPASFEEDISNEELVLEYLGWIVEEVHDEEGGVAFVDAALEVTFTELLLQVYFYECDENDKEVEVDRVKQLVTDIFDAKVAMHQLEVDALQQELAEHQGRLEHAKENRSGIIQRRVEDLTESGDDDDFDW